MKVFVSPFPFRDRILIHDDASEPKIDKNKNYQLVFTTGDVTLKIFKLFYLQNIESYFVIANMEYFLLKMRIFRNLKFICWKNQKERDLVPKGASMDKNQSVEKMKAKYCKIEKHLGNKKDLGKGIELSFQPKMLESIRSSLESSSLYKSKDMKCHGVFKCLENGRLSLNDFKNDEESQKTIKSLIFAGILIKKDDSIHLNEVLI